MSQSVKIFVFVVLAFLVFITSKGQLPTYLSYFKLGNGAQGGETGNDLVMNYGNTTKTLTDKVGEAEKAAQTVYNAEQAAEAAYQTIVANNGNEVASGESEIAAAIESASFT